MATPGGEATLAWFERGPDSTCGETVFAVDVGNGVKVARVTVDLENLLSDQVYHCRLASNHLGVADGVDLRHDGRLGDGFGLPDSAGALA